jgi:superfamily II DNA helicase RecQ
VRACVRQRPSLLTRTPHARHAQEGTAPLRLKALYVTPELLQKNARVRAGLTALAGRGLLSLIAIDEAHCVTDWGACREGA